VHAAYDTYSREAAERGVFGAPTFLLDGERFWGQDRLGFVDRALERLAQLSTPARADNRSMRIRFTKMQGAGNDFVVLDETAGRLGLSAQQYRRLADRHFGVGADQVLSVRPSPGPGIDFEYVIHNADGGEVEQCGNGARCFARYVATRA
jgi:hypothetical protein